MNTKYPYTITEWQMQLLSEIFRVVVKEITCDEDKLHLAPGEIGISYTEGAFYIRDPHTGELFSPNSIGHVKQILSKYNPETNILNADRIADLRFYSNISQLSQLGISMSPDTIIRQMEYPAVLLSPVEYENYNSLGFPSKSGVIVVLKLLPEFVMCRYYDNLTYTYYDGKYNSITQFFEGWMRNDAEKIYIDSVGGGDQTKISSDKPLTDLMVVTVRVSKNLNPGAKVSYNDGEYLPIINKNGTPLDTQIAANNIIMLIYDNTRKAWILTDSTDTSLSSIIDIQQKRIKDLTDQLDHAVKDYTERISALKKETDSQVAALKSRPGLISSVTSVFTATIDNTDTIGAIDGFDPRYDKLVVNFNQTILRESLDYQIDPLNAEKTSGGLIFPKIRLMKGDTLVLIVLKQPTD